MDKLASPNKEEFKDKNLKQVKMVMVFLSRNATLSERESAFFESVALRDGVGLLKMVAEQCPNLLRNNCTLIVWIGGKRILKNSRK